VPRSAPASEGGVQHVSHSPTAPTPTPTVIRAQGVDPLAGPPPVPPPSPIAAPPPSEPFNCGVVGGGNPFAFGTAGCRSWFQSDHCFDQFSSPISSPFLSEDPRALTEIRPIFIYQSAPSSNTIFRGGNLEWFGVQARVAFTDRWSFVMHKLGWTRMDPNNPSDGFDTSTGFSEVWLGPKYTFLRNDNTNTIGAVGLTFQIPGGSSRVLQDTGSLSLTPYVSLGQTFWRTSYGSVNALGTMGYNFRTDNARTEYFFFNWHLDYNIANLNKIYPMIEMNWTSFTRAGEVRPLTFEGADLANFGSTGVSGNNNLTLATGLRYKFTECIQTGIATEWPVVGRRDLLDFRLTADLIFRY
jgi:hypothetical protein